MAVEYTDAPAVRAAALALIDTMEDHYHLADAKIAYLFRSEATKAKGKEVAGSASKCSDKDRFLHEHDLIVEVAQDKWAVMTEEQRIALVDHELCHFQKADPVDGRPTWAIFPCGPCIRSTRWRWIATWAPSARRSPN